ncbi:MAG: carbonic anhydrase [Lachnospiraceae bacterium]|nr:carbonic anhydrase [Lachnospiraceae bacterium]
MNAAEALEKLKEGNRRYVEGAEAIDISASAREDKVINGQHPYAVVVACSDSRVIPEAIFNAGIGDLFVIRVAGNVIDPHQLGSVEYATSHLHCPLVLVLGHRNCGAVAAALEIKEKIAQADVPSDQLSTDQQKYIKDMHGDAPDGDPIEYISSITRDIIKASGNLTDPDEVSLRNAEVSAEKIRRACRRSPYRRVAETEVVSALYDILTGEVVWGASC